MEGGVFASNWFAWIKKKENVWWYVGSPTRMLNRHKKLATFQQEIKGFFIGESIQWKRKFTIKLKLQKVERHRVSTKTFLGRGY